jgi:hypothetical protein
MHLFDHGCYPWRLRQPQHQEQWKFKVKYLALRGHAAEARHNQPHRLPGPILSRYLFRKLKDMKALEILYIVWYEGHIHQWPEDIWQDRIKETMHGNAAFPGETTLMLYFLAKKLCVLHSQR